MNILLETINVSSQILKMGHIPLALDVLYTIVDDMLRKGEFDTIDNVLEVMEVPKLEIHIVLGILTITLAAKSKLLNRDKFFASTKEFYKERLIKEPNLLIGLD